MPKLKPGTIVPSNEDDAAINAGIAADPDTRELDKESFKIGTIGLANSLRSSFMCQKFIDPWQL